MKDLDFPIYKTKRPNSKVESYDLNSVEDRKRYFTNKVGQEISELKEYMRDNTFICYLLGKKQAGKGTYTKLLAEVFGSDIIKHISVGDLVRDLDDIESNQEKKDDLRKYLEENYRGYISIDEIFEALKNRSTKTILPTEFALTLLKREISKHPECNLFIDGFPRTMDQVSYSLYFRELINHRDDPDIFVMIDVPEALINERIKGRRSCPLCNTSRQLFLLPTKRVRYNDLSKEFYLECDNPECKPVKMLAKEGDELGVEIMRDRLESDEKLIHQTYEMHGIPKILLRSSVPVDKVDEYCDDYEITQIHEYSVDEKGNIKTNLKDWIFDDDDGIPSKTLVGSAVALAFIDQLHKILVKKEI